MLQGCDIALVVVEVDTNNPRFDDKILKDLELPQIEYVDTKDLDHLK